MNHNGVKKEDDRIMYHVLGHNHNEAGDLQRRGPISRYGTGILFGLLAQ